MRWPFSKKITALGSISGIVILAVVILVVVTMRSSHDTYVKIVDNANLERDNSPSPGADIRAVSLERASGTKKFVHDVVSFTQPDAASAAKNQYANSSTVIGEWDNKKTPPHLALSRGGELIVHIASNYSSNDVIHIYETGLPEGRTAEYYTVYIAPEAQGPWTLLGEKAGESTLTIPK